MTTADKLREISMVLQIHKKLDRNELLAVMGSLIDIAELTGPPWLYQVE